MRCPAGADQSFTVTDRSTLPPPQNPLKLCDVYLVRGPHLSSFFLALSVAAKSSLAPLSTFETSCDRCCSWDPAIPSHIMDTWMRDTPCLAASLQLKCALEQALLHSEVLADS